MNPKSLFDDIKEAAAENGSIELQMDKFNIPLKLADKKAIQVVEMLMDDPELEGLTFRGIHEILDFSKFWLEFIQLLKHNDDLLVETSLHDQAKHN